MHHIEEDVSLMTKFMTKECRCGTRAKKPGFQTRTKNAGARPRVNTPSLKYRIIPKRDVLLFNNVHEVLYAIVRPNSIRR